MDGVKSPNQLEKREKVVTEEAKQQIARIGATQSIRRNVHSFGSPKAHNSVSSNLNTDLLKPVLMIVSGVSAHHIASKPRPILQSETFAGQRINSHDAAKQNNSVSLFCSKLEPTDYT